MTKRIKQNAIDKKIVKLNNEITTMSTWKKVDHKKLSYLKGQLIMLEYVNAGNGLFPDGITVDEDELVYMKGAIPVLVGVGLPFNMHEFYAREPETLDEFLIDGADDMLREFQGDDDDHYIIEDKCEKKVNTHKVVWYMDCIKTEIESNVHNRTTTACFTALFDFYDENKEEYEINRYELYSDVDDWTAELETASDVEKATLMGKIAGAKSLLIDGTFLLKWNDSYGGPQHWKVTLTDENGEPVKTFKRKYDPETNEYSNTIVEVYKNTEEILKTPVVPKEPKQLDMEKVNVALRTISNKYAECESDEEKGFLDGEQLILNYIVDGFALGDDKTTLDMNVIDALFQDDDAIARVLKLPDYFDADSIDDGGADMTRLDTMYIGAEETLDKIIRTDCYTVA